MPHLKHTSQLSHRLLFLSIFHSICYLTSLVIERPRPVKTSLGERERAAVTEFPFVAISSAFMMITTTTTGSVFLDRAPLCPPPLTIQKKPRKPNFRRRIFRKSTPTYSDDQYVFGPLDDIIDEIKSDIWESPPDYSFDSSVFDWARPLEASWSWSVTPLPVSRTPSDHPLTIRKNRNSRSSASGSSFGDPMAFSRNNSHDEPENSGPVRCLHTTTFPSWPIVDVASNEATHLFTPPAFAASAEHMSAQQALGKVISGPETRDEPPKRRISKLRLFTSGLPLLRRQNTGETSVGAGNTSDTSSPTATEALAAHRETEEGSEVERPSDQAVVDYLRLNARKFVNFDDLVQQLLKSFSGKKLASVMSRIAKRLPSPSDLDDDVEAQMPGSKSLLPTTLRAAIRMFPETKLVTEEFQELSVAIELEGVLYNRKPLPDTSIDVIFVVDNGYYVTAACLEKSLDAINGALYHLGHGDRLALYTTHCTHRDVTGNRPEVLYPLQPVCADVEETIQGLTSRIAQSGSQLWDPPRPNPSMTDVILGIARSMQGKRLKADRTHVVVLSPVAHVLHDVSKSFPGLYIHRINPALLPYRREPEFQDTICLGDCCKNVFATNWSKYQSTSDCIKRILKNARSENPIGELSEVSVDIRTMSGCELLSVDGGKAIPWLFPGQVHTLFARIRVNKAETQSIKFDSKNPILNSCLNAHGLRQELLNAVRVGATKVHILDVQVLHQNSLHDARSWNYVESPLMLIRELGGLAPPQDTSMEFYKRQLFCKLAQGPADEANIMAEKTLSALPEYHEQAKKLLERMAQEIECHLAISEYEKKHRQRLPLCPGPIEIEGPHEWLDDMWVHRKNKHSGMHLA
ncbi:hypothetical protein G6011_05360 [Alternaria panax]|uniref:Uncharacterized protein n=1 Tax=Alternaria panax TaxID=48097 RepID=A0AAD4FH52_9PLEO|nr:hypothetical protein G6011_05360 [Alternaria panax]